MNYAVELHRVFNHRSGYTFLLYCTRTPTPALLLVSEYYCTYCTVLLLTSLYCGTVPCRRDLFIHILYVRCTTEYHFTVHVDRHDYYVDVYCSMEMD